MKSEASRRRDPSFLTDPSEVAILVPWGQAPYAGRDLPRAKKSRRPFVPGRWGPVERTED